MKSFKKRILSGVLAVATMASMVSAIGASAETADIKDCPGATSVQLIFGQNATGFAPHQDIPDWTWDLYHPGKSCEVVKYYMGWTGTGRNRHKTVFKRETKTHTAHMIDYFDGFKAEASANRIYTRDGGGVVRITHDHYNCDLTWNTTDKKGYYVIEVCDNSINSTVIRKVVDAKNGSCHLQYTSEVSDTKTRNISIHVKAYCGGYLSQRSGIVSNKGDLYGDLF